MANRYGPTRGEHRFRLIASLAALALLGFALWRHDQSGPAAWLEIAIFGGGFLGGSALWSAWHLWKGRG